MHAIFLNVKMGEYNYIRSVVFSLTHFILSNFLIVTVADDVNLELDVRKSVSELKVSNISVLQLFPS